jgi:hypothetical protein
MPRKQKTNQDFINEAKIVHGELYDYSKTNYVHALTKITINCKTHGDFEQTPNKHLRGSGCPKCSHSTKRKTTEEFIFEANKVHNNLYEYSKANYINSKTKICITCKTHGDFKQIPGHHLKNQGCPKCSGKNKTTEDFINEANKVHNNLYDYSKSNYVNATTQMCIICKIHGDFEQAPINHLYGNGCPKCSGKNITTQDFINQANKVHNNLYDYSKSNYVNSTTKICITCKIHGDFEQLSNTHLYGSGCHKCSFLKNADLHRGNKEDFIKKSNILHNNLYDYTKVNYINQATKVIICCKIHGDFEQTPNNHTHKERPRGCQKCSIVKNGNNQRSNKDVFIERANKIHNNLYDYSSVEYINCELKIKIICKTHGEFIQRPMHHLNGNGCPKCNTRGFSKLQINWLNFISIYYGLAIIHAENEKEFIIPNTKLKADGYCVETNTIYEFHGDYWHGNPNIYCSNQFNKTTKCTFGELYQITINKEQKIRDKGFNLITIWENDWNKLNNCVKIIQRKFRHSKSH